MSGDLTARIADLATLIDDHTVEDEEAAGRATGGEWISAIAFVMSEGMQIAKADAVRTAMHMARHDPDRVLRRVKATRDLVAAILAEGHQ